eukprot:gene2296-2643_t
MYHAGTPPTAKEHILKEMTKDDSHLRILVCTLAFGMRVNCKKVHRVVYFGPPENIEAFVQEVGRAGRDGGHSVSVLLYNGLLSSRSSADMHSFINETKCRRKVLVEHFPSKQLFNCGKCMCCDLCAANCSCDNDQCNFLKAKFVEACEEAVSGRSRHCSAEQKNGLKELLVMYSNTCKEISTKYHAVSCPNIWLEFNNWQIEQVLRNCKFIFNLEDVLKYVEIWRVVHANHVITAIHRVFQDTEVNVDELYTIMDIDVEETGDLNSTWDDIREDSSLYTFNSRNASLISAEIEEMDKSGCCDEDVSEVFNSSVALHNFSDDLDNTAVDIVD